MLSISGDFDDFRRLMELATSSSVIGKSVVPLVMTSEVCGIEPDERLLGLFKFLK